VDVGESPLIKYTVARCATHFPLACEAIQVPRQGFDYPCAGDHMIARQLVLRIRLILSLFPRPSPIAHSLERVPHPLPHFPSHLILLYLRMTPEPNATQNR
jgi:hypothetical protein